VEKSNVLQWAWNVIESMDQTQLADLLEFVSGCRLPPLNGFTGDQKDQSWFQIEVDPLRFGLHPTSTPTESVMSGSGPQTVGTMAESGVGQTTASIPVDSSDASGTPPRVARGPVVVNLPRSSSGGAAPTRLLTGGSTTLNGVTDVLEVAAIVAQLAAQNGGVLPSTIDGRPFTTAERVRLNYLPESQTCFKQLILGLFDSETELREKLFYAIANSKTMEKK
jgi:hypothetical protein